MYERFACSPKEVKHMTTAQLREAFLIQDLFKKDEISFVYAHYDRMITGGVVPANKSIQLNTYEPLKSSFFLERREMGIINIGGSGKVTADGVTYKLNKLDCLYLGRDTKDIIFESIAENDTARFFLLSCPAHNNLPAQLMKGSEATPAVLGSAETSNQRTIYKYIFEGGIQSCQLVMGLTVLQTGSVWNTMPPHTHNRRMEVYLYFDVPAEQRVFHLMGEPNETRHLVVSNGEAVLSAPWSIHSGCGTCNYSFIWGMAGENQSFADMDGVPLQSIL